MPGADNKVSDIPDADGASQDVSELGVGVAVGGGQRGHIDGISNGLVTRRVDHVSQRLLGVLNAPALRVSVPQEHQLLLLPCPKASDTFFIHLQHKRVSLSIVSSEKAIKESKTFYFYLNLLQFSP